MQMMLVTILICAALVAITFALHLATLKNMAREVLGHQQRLKHPVMIVLLSVFAVHLLEVLVYAIAFLGIDYLGIGGLEGAVHPSHATLYDHFYFSIASYTTLGIGDVVPHGAIRLVAGVEALNGLVLIAWSASFTYLMMERLWSRELGGSPD